MLKAPAEERMKLIAPQSVGGFVQATGSVKAADRTAPPASRPRERDLAKVDEVPNMTVPFSPGAARYRDCRMSAYQDKSDRRRAKYDVCSA